MLNRFNFTAKVQMQSDCVIKPEMIIVPAINNAQMGVHFLPAKDPKLTDFDDDLYETMPFKKSHFFLLQIIEWPINTDTHYPCVSPAAQCMAMFALN